MAEANGMNRPERLAIWREWANRLSLPVLCSVLATVVIAFISFYLYWDRGLIWIDETFSLWATEAGRSPWAMQTELLKSETNPPLHFWLLYGFRRLIDEPRLAGHALNFVIAGLSLTAITSLNWRAGRPRLGAFLGIVYLMSASSMSFMQDIRAGFTALSLCALSVALSGSVRLNKAASPKVLIFATMLGLLIGISHVYAALFTGALAATLVLEALLIRNRSQLVFGLVLGATCSFSFGLWWIGLMQSTGGRLEAIAWLAHAGGVGMDLIWRAYLGPPWLIVFIAAGMVMATLTQAGRRAFLVPLICAVLVLGIVVLVSLKTPILFFRYFLILAPAIHLLAALVVYDLIKAYEAAPNHQRAGLAAFGAAMALSAPLLTGISNAAFLVKEQDPWWTGIERVRAEAAHCPSRHIRVMISDDPGMADSKRWGFSYLLRPIGLEYEDAGIGIRDVSDIDCRIVGWGEHLLQTDAGIVGHPVTDADLLRLMNLTNRQNLPLVIERHTFGFVIYKQKG